MVNLARIDKNVYKSLGFKNKSIGQTMIKEVLQTKVTNYKTIPALGWGVRYGRFAKVDNSSGYEKWT